MSQPDQLDVTMLDVGLALMEAGYSPRYAEGPMVRLAVETAINAYRDAGLLIRSGGERREQWCVTYLGTFGRDLWCASTDDRTEADKALERAIGEGRWRELRIERRAVRTWPDGAIFIGPWWSEVPDVAA